MKPNLNFLRKVSNGEVRAVKGYTTKKGGYHKFVGGEATAKAHAKAGYISMPGVPSLGRPSFAKLTDAGQAALQNDT